MATSNIEIQCFSCKKQIRTFLCQGCSKDFCSNCLLKHLQELNKEFDQIENDHDQFKQKINDQKINHSNKLLFIEEIDQWEKDSISKIKQKADECRKNLIDYSNKFLIHVENKLINIAQNLKQIRKENNFNEIDLNQFKQKLNELKEEFDKLTNISIEQRSSTFINEIFLILPFYKETIWKRFGITIAGRKGLGNEFNQLYYPHGIFIDDDQTIYTGDCFNHRIVEWKSNATNGQRVAGGNGSGNEISRLNLPTDVTIDQETNSLIIADCGNRRVMRWSRQNQTNGQVIISNIDCWGVAMDKYGSLYVSDYKKNEVRRWKRQEKNGTLITIGNRKDDQLNYPTHIFIDEDDSLFVSDSENHRVMKWVKDAREGIVVAGGNGCGNSLTQLSNPRGVIVDRLGQIYVTDRGNHRVMRWCSGAKEGTIVVGGNEQGQESNQFYYPIGLSFDRQGNLYVADCVNNRIQKFEVE